LKALLNALPGVSVVGEAAGGDRAIERIGRLPTDIVIVHAHTLRAGEIETIKRIVRVQAKAMVIVLTPCSCPRSLVRAVAAGASGVFVYRDLDVEDIGNVIRDIGAAPVAVDLASGDGVRDDREQSDEMPVSHFLTPREMQILRMIGDGKSNREIAASLGLRLKTVKNHINRIYTKLSPHDDRQAPIIPKALDGIQ